MSLTTSQVALVTQALATGAFPGNLVQRLRDLRLKLAAESPELTTEDAVFVLQILANMQVQAASIDDVAELQDALQAIIRASGGISTLPGDNLANASRPRPATKTGPIPTA